MRKIIAVMSMSLLITTATTFASPTTEFEQGATSLELGGTLNSRVSGKGKISPNVPGESGYKVGITTGLSNNLAIQYKQGMFKSQESTILGITTFAQAKPNDFNLLYKVNSNLTFIAGYENTKISYGKAVTAASKSALHFGFTGTHKLDDKATLFATILSGKDVMLKEVGVSYALSKDTTFNVSYAERNVKKVDLDIPAIPALKGKIDYTMKGISCLFSFKLK